MSVVEKKIEQEVMIAHSQEHAGRLFRNNTGTGWVGDKPVKTSEGILIRNPRPLRAGLIKGSLDTIGWTPVKVTPEMVGKTIAVFTTFEMKDVKGRASEEQRIFIGNVNNAGGIVGIIRTIDDYRREMKAWLERITSM